MRIKPDTIPDTFRHFLVSLPRYTLSYTDSTDSSWLRGDGGVTFWGGKLRFLMYGGNFINVGMVNWPGNYRNIVSEL